MSYSRETESWNRKNKLGPGLRAGRDRAKLRAPCVPLSTLLYPGIRLKEWFDKKTGVPRTPFPTTSDQFIKDLNLFANLASLLSNQNCNTNADTFIFKHSLAVKCSSLEPRSTPTESHPQELQQRKRLLKTWVKRIWNKNWNENTEERRSALPALLAPLKDCDTSCLLYSFSYLVLWAEK